MTTLATRSLWPTLAAMVLSIAALPAAAQNQLWIDQFGTSAADWAFASAADGTGGVFVGGMTVGDLGSPNAGGSDAWLTRYDGTGNQLWTRQFGSNANENLYTATPDGVGGVYTAGSTLGSLGTPSAGGWDGWLASYDSAGQRNWMWQFGTEAHDIAYASAPDSSDGVYVAGSTVGNLGGHYLGGGGDAWLARFDKAGNQLWIRQLGTSSYDAAYAAAPDGTGGLYVGGRTDGSLSGANVGGWDAWLARYDNSGNQLWLRQLGTNSAEYLQDVSPDDSGGVYVSGATEGELGGPSAGTWDAWVARYDRAGNQLWIRQQGTSDADFGGPALPDGSGGVYASGSTRGDLGGPNAGDFDVWLARYDGAGNKLWILQLGTDAADYTYIMEPDGTGGMHVGGLTAGSLGGLNAGDYDAWLARYEDPCGVYLNYCTAKPNSLNCSPSIATSGMPSASAGSGFTVSVTNVLDKQFGLFFYSRSGPASTPFQGGTLCVMPPVVRTPVHNSGGAPPCDGVFAIDFNAYVASGADPALVAGQQVWIQNWSRDPGFAPPNNTSLSDALSFTLCP